MPPPLARNMDDDHNNDDLEASPHGQYSNTDLEILDDAFKACRGILSEVADKVQQPFQQVMVSVRHLVPINFLMIY
jgi:hypothetical protein